MSFLFVRSLYSCLKISHVVETVENTNDIDSVCYRFLYEILYNIISVWTVSKDILSTEQHLKFCILESITELSKSLPWIFFQETEGSIECCSTPALYSMISNLVHLLNDWHHLLCCHSGSNQRLMCITQNSFYYFNWFFFNFCHLFILLIYLTPKIAINVPAATAVPITPATFGPIACIRRKFVGSASAPTF